MLKRIIGTTWTNAKAKGWGYWIFWLVSVGIAFRISPLIERSESLLSLRYDVSGFVDRLSPRQARPHSTVLVEIKDQDFWGPLQGKRPVSRAYLARLARSLALYRPSVIVLDFDFSAIRPDSAPEPEDQTLVDALVSVGRSTRVVMPLVLACPDPSPLPCPNNADPQILPTAFEDLSEGLLVSFGYINFSLGDVRKVPLALPLKIPKKVMVSSLSLASAQAHSSTLPVFKDEHFPHASFVDGINYQGRRFEAGDILAAYEPPAEVSDTTPQFLFDQASERQKELFRRLNSQIVLVGGSFHRDGPGRGPLEDMRNTPAGPMPGYEIHANYVEALLDERAVLPANQVWLTVIKLAFTLALTAVLISQWGDLKKTLVLLWALAILLVIAYLGSIALGVFVETLLPGVLVTGHFLLDIVFDWWKEAQHARAHMGKH